MKIIKAGKNIPLYKKIVNCKYCDCVFEVDYDEYEGTSQIEILHDDLPQWNCICPCCGKKVYFD